MKINRINNILSEDNKSEIFYNDRPVWVQSVKKNIARVGFIDNFDEKDVYIEDLYEKNLYN